MVYTFDDLGQLLTSDSTVIPNENFTYDDAGNRLQGDNVIGPNNQLLSDGIFDYEYDAEGNLVSRTDIATGEHTSYEFDHRNRMISATRFSSGGIILSESEFEYNVFDELIRRSVDADGSGPQEAETLVTVYENGNAWADFDDSGMLIAQYLFGDRLDSNIARFRIGEGTAWYLSDQLVSIRDIVDASGNLINHIEYDSYGNILLETNSAAGDRFKFTGREFQSELGVYYYRARFYDPTSGRFISQDPIGFSGGDQNLYGYVGNRPLLFTDPTGNEAVISYDVQLTGISTVPLYVVKGTCFVISVVTNFYIDAGLDVLFGDGDPSVDVADGAGLFADVAFAAISCLLFPPAQFVSGSLSLVAVALANSVAVAGVRSAATQLVLEGTVAFAKAAGGGSNSAPKRVPASEKQVKNMAKRMEKELGKDARREFHDLKDKALGDRTMQEALEDAASLFEDAGKEIPPWLRDRLR